MPRATDVTGPPRNKILSLPMRGTGPTFSLGVKRLKNGNFEEWGCAFKLLTLFFSSSNQFLPDCHFLWECSFPAPLASLLPLYFGVVFLQSFVMTLIFVYSCDVFIQRTLDVCFSHQLWWHRMSLQLLRTPWLVEWMDDTTHCVVAWMNEWVLTTNGWWDYWIQFLFTSFYSECECQLSYL